MSGGGSVNKIPLMNNDKSALSSLMTTRIPKSIGLRMGEEVPNLSGMVYLCTSFTSAFYGIPYRTRFAFKVVIGEDGKPYEVYPGTKEFYVHVAVSETEYEEVFQSLQAEEAKARKERGETKETVKQVPFDEKQVDSKVLEQLGRECWKPQHVDEDEETRPSRHADNTPLSEVLRRAGFGSAEEVAAEVVARAPKPEVSDSIIWSPTPKPPTPPPLELSPQEIERRRKVSDGVRRSWALRKSVLENAPSLPPSNGSESEKAETEGPSKASLGQKKRWEKIRAQQALRLNRAPQLAAPATVSEEKVLLLDIQSSRTGYLDVKDAELPGMQLSINFPRQYWLVERVWGGVLWLCLQSNPKVGLPSQEFWELTRKSVPGIKVVITY